LNCILTKKKKNIFTTPFWVLWHQSNWIKRQQIFDLSLLGLVSIPKHVGLNYIYSSASCVIKKDRPHLHYSCTQMCNEPYNFLHYMKIQDYYMNMKKVAYIWCASCVMDGTRKEQLAPSVDEHGFSIVSDIVSGQVATMPSLTTCMCRNHNAGKQGHKKKGASHGIFGGFHPSNLLLHENWKESLSEQCKVPPSLVEREGYPEADLPLH